MKYPGITANLLNVEYIGFDRCEIDDFQFNLPPACTDEGLRSLMGLRLEILYVAGSQCSKAALAQARKDGITEFIVII